MKLTRVSILLALAATGCPSGPPGNPSELWLALNGAETRVQLVPSQPDPF